MNKGIARLASETNAFKFVPGDSWKQYAACNTAPHPEIFFPTRYEQEQYGIGEAEAFCGACPVRTECLSEALDMNETGTWGGMTNMDRNKLKNRTTRKVYGSPAELARFLTEDMPKCMECGNHRKKFADNLCATCWQARRRENEGNGHAETSA